MERPERVNGFRSFVSPYRPVFHRIRTFLRFFVYNHAENFSNQERREPLKFIWERQRMIPPKAG
jgi:hypothetical protein